ncbi:MAG: PAS domain S-box protein [Burkholderiales bacterium]|nr:PAS domain S-box protein [Burkholderiales bacterium]
MHELTEPALQALFDADLPIGLAVLDRDLRYVRINTTLCRFNGVTAEQALGHTVAEVLPEAFRSVEAFLRRVLDTGEAVENFQVTVNLPSQWPQAVDWLASYRPIRSADGAVLGVLVEAVNLTLEQRAKRALAESEAHVRRVLNSLFAFVGVLTTQGVLIEANRAPLEAAGIDSVDVLDRPFWDTYWFSHDAGLQDWLRDATARAAQGDVIRRDVVVRMKHDSRMTLDFMLAPMRNDEGEITHLIPSAIDISDRKANEHLLATAMAQFRSAFQSAPEGMALVEPPGLLTLVNPAFCTLFGYPAEDLLGQSVALLVPTDRRHDHNGLMDAFFSAPQERSMAPKRRIQGRRADGSLLDIEVGLNPVAGTSPVQVLVTVVDITERLRIHGVLEQGLREKTVLLNEVHHRVKNNLQLIASLLRLQSRHSSGEAQQALSDSIGRVKAIALTHQLLYETKNFAEVDLNQFLRRLCGLLRDSYPDAFSKVHIDMRTLTTAQPLSLHRAVTCGLLVNELVTNAIKHAFPDRQRGTVSIDIQDLPPGRVRVRVADDGVGLASDQGLGQGNTLGFQLVPLLGKQLGASVTQEDGPGCRFVIEFSTDGEAP